MFAAAISDCVEQQKPGRHEDNSCRFLRTSHSRTSLDRYSNFFARISISTTGLPGSEYSLPIFQHHSISAGNSSLQLRDWSPRLRVLRSPFPTSTQPSSDVLHILPSSTRVLPGHNPQSAKNMPRRRGRASEEGTRVKEYKEAEKHAKFSLQCARDAASKGLDDKALEHLDDAREDGEE